MSRNGKVITADEVAFAICGREHFARGASGELYYFHSGRYRSGGDHHVKRLVKAFMWARGAADKWSTHLANEVVEYIRTDAPALWQTPPLGLINLQNGILDVESRRLVPPDPAYLWPVQLPVTYDPAARPDAILKFLSETLPQEAQQPALEVFPWLLWQDSSIQKAVVLLGDGANGKSRYLRLVSAFVGSENLCSVSLQKLETSTFAAARLEGKLLNLCGELPPTRLSSTNTFKALTGGDRIHAEKKFKESYEFDCHCRQIYATNHFPVAGDGSYAYARRWVLIEFSRVFRADDPMTVPASVLDARLRAPQELSGLLNLALYLLPSFRQRGFTESASSKAILEDCISSADQDRIWLEAMIEEDPTGYVAKRELRSRYEQESGKAKRSPLSKVQFGSAVKRAFPQVTDGQRTICEHRVDVYLGVRFKVVSFV